MAASYFGKFDSQELAQQALDQGQLLKPFVAMWGNQLHYDDLDEVSGGTISPNEITGVTSSQTFETVYVYAGSLYWQAVSSENWVGFNGSSSGYSDGSFSLDINENHGTEERNAQVRVSFYYDSQHEYLRNVQTVAISQQAYEPPTSATVTLSSSELDSNNQWAYLMVSDSNGLYWTATPPAWINGGESVNSEGDNAWWFEVPENATQDRSGTFVVDFYSDAAHENYLFSEEAEISQQGRGEYAPSFNAEFYLNTINVGYQSGTTNVYIIDNPGYAFKAEVDGYESTGTSATTSVQLSYNENGGYQSTSKTIGVTFYSDDQFQQEIETKYLTINMEGNPDALYVEWEDGDNSFPSAGGSRNFYMYFDNTAATKYSFSVDSGSGHFNSQAGPTAFTATTADVTTGVTFYADANTGTTGIWGSILVQALDVSDQTIAIYSLGFYVQEVQPIVSAVCTFVTAQDNEQKNVPAYDGGNWMNAYIDNDPSNVLPTNEGTYTFGSAGTHTVTYLRESSDTTLQNWLTNSDMVSCQITCDSDWGMHSNDYFNFSTSQVLYNNPYLTGVTLGAGMTRIGSDNFKSCYALSAITFLGTTAPSFAGDPTIPFTTLSGTTGTVTIPAGATSSDFSQIMDNLGSGWTLVQS